MTSILTTDTKSVEPVVGTEHESIVSGEQEDQYRIKAQEILKQLQVVLVEGAVPGTDAISDLLLKAEEVLFRQAQSSSIDAETRKTLEDIAQLAGSTKQLARHKDLGDRLSRIAEETKKALEATKEGNVPAASREATQRAIDLVETWRPLFQVILRSRSFRVLIVDFIKIFRSVLLRQSYKIGKVAEEEFVEGKSITNIAKDVKQEVQSEDVKSIISDSEWEEMENDAVRLLSAVTKHPDYREGIERLFSLLDLAREEFQWATKQVTSLDPHIHRARVETEELVASFAGKKTLRNWIESLKDVIAKVEKDDRAKSFLCEMKEFILSTKSGETLSKEQYQRKAREFATKGRQIVEEYKYVDELNAFLTQSDELMENIRNDEFIRVLRHHAGIVASDISYVDKDGNVQLDMDMIGKLRSVIVPVLAETLKYIPIPRIEDSDDYRDYWVDNIVICGYDIIPENIKFHLESDAEVSFKEGQPSKTDSKLIITLKNIRTEVKDMDFYYFRKSFPEMKEKGRFSVRLSGEGAELTLIFKVVQDDSSSTPKLTEGSSHFHIHKMDIEFDKQSLTHRLVVPMMTSLFHQQIQSSIEHSVEQNMSVLIKRIGEGLTSALSQVNRPFVGGFDTFREAIKASELNRAYQNRREKLE